MTNNLKVKLLNIIDELSSITEKDEIIINDINNNLDDIIEDIKHYKILLKNNINNDDINLIDIHKKKRDFAKNIFPLFHYLYTNANS